MAILDWINPFNKVVDLVSEVVTDKDKKIALDAALNELKQQVYMTELNTKTVPWVDALHKMGRQIMSVLTLIVGATLYHLNPDVDIVTLAAVLGASSGPTAIYNVMKGRGK